MCWTDQLLSLVCLLILLCVFFFCYGWLNSIVVVGVVVGVAGVVDDGVASSDGVIGVDVVVV